MEQDYLKEIEKCKKSAAFKIEKYNDDLKKQAENNLKHVIEETNIEIPNKYNKIYILNELLELIEDGRADSIKETINLYEDIKLKTEQTDRINRMNLEIEEQAEHEREMKEQCNDCKKRSYCPMANIKTVKCKDFESDWLV